MMRQCKSLATQLNIFSDTVHCSLSKNCLQFNCIGFDNSETGKSITMVTKAKLSNFVDCHSIKLNFFAKRFTLHAYLHFCYHTKVVFILLFSSQNLFSKHKLD